MTKYSVQWPKIGGRNQIQYDSKGCPIYSVDNVANGNTLWEPIKTRKTIQLLCKLCGPGNHEDTDCLKQKGINMLDMEEQAEAILAITRAQIKKTVYLEPRMEKERLW